MNAPSLVVPMALLPHGEGLELPAFATPHAAAMDLRAALPEARPCVLAPGARGLIPTGLVLAIPQGFEGQVRPRSGLALKHGVTVLNAPGTIDADYRGEVQVVLVNLGEEPFVVRRGDRIAQLLIAPAANWTWLPVAEPGDLGQTVRGAGGYGSTGRS